MKGVPRNAPPSISPNCPPIHQTATVALYVHVPFCRHLCPYCAFYKQENPSTDSIDTLVDALIAEIKTYAPYGLSLRSIFWGGGTPTLLEPEHWEKLHAAITTTFHVPKDTEHTVEANPETVTAALLTRLHRIGVNRISLGVQSFFDKPLGFLGRQHGQDTLKKALALLFSGPIQNINLDLMYGLPKEAEQHIADELDMAFSYPITHLSTYALTIEPGTPFAKKKVTSPEDRTWEDYTHIQSHLKTQGFTHYEISAFTKDGYACAHNLAYWTLSPYIGIGPSATSYWRGVSYKQVSDLARYVLAPHPKWLASKESPENTHRDFAADYMIANFRRLTPLSLDKIEEDLGLNMAKHYTPRLQTLVSQGWLSQNNTHYQLTQEGIRMHNFVLETLI